MRLVDIRALSKANTLWPLWDLLNEREPQDSISHNAMPAWNEHVAFVESYPYQAWYFIQTEASDLVSTIYLSTEAETGIVGTIYLSRFKEISWSIFKRYHDHGYEAEAIELLMKAHPLPFYLANVNPLNEPKIAALKKIGFSLAFVQATYKLVPK